MADTPDRADLATAVSQLVQALSHCTDQATAEECTQQILPALSEVGRALDKADLRHLLLDATAWDPINTTGQWARKLLQLSHDPDPFTVKGHLKDYLDRGQSLARLAEHVARFGRDAQKELAKLKGDDGPPALTDEEILTGPMIQLASDVPDLGKAPDSISELWQWCNRHRENLRNFRIALGLPPPAQRATDEFRYIPEVVHQCRQYLRGFGCKDIPEQFAFPKLPRDQTPTDPPHWPLSDMEKFLSWASGYRNHGHGIFEVIGKVEEFLTWAMSWCKEKQSEAEAKAAQQEPAAVQYVTLDQMAAIVSRSKRTLERLKTRRNNPLPDPAVPGGGGRPDEWIWSQVRPWLAQEFKRNLPEKFPPRQI